MTTTWKLDPLHSAVEFKVRHLMTSEVNGRFEKFEGSASTEGDRFETVEVKFTADADSVFTGNAQRDAHLRSPDFLDAAAHMKISFCGKGVQKTEGSCKLTGRLTIRGKTRPLLVDVRFTGLRDEGARAGFEIRAKIHRRQFGLNWKDHVAGGLILGEEVAVMCKAEFVKDDPFLDAA